MRADQEVQVRLAVLIIEIYDVLCQQSHRCKIEELAKETSRQEVVDWAQVVMEDWHELHEFDPAAFANPVLLRTLLNMYSDLVAEYHQLEGLPKAGMLTGLRPNFIKMPH